ncbi:MAG: serine hydrolase domain-containing protein [Lysobacterales bacterium]
MLWKALAALLLAAAGATSAVAASAGGNSGPAPADALAQEVRGWVEVVAASGAAPALAVAIVRPGQPDALITAGVPYSGAVDAIDEHTVFRLASVSKGFAATLCGLLADAGFMAMDQSVVDLVPGLKLADPNAETALTLERLLSHQTGLPHHTFDMKLEANASVSDLLQSLPTVPPACAVGGCYAYQNVMFNLAADVAFGAVGSFFPVELSRQLLVPLQMTDTSVGREALLDERNWARPHVYTRGGWTAVEPKPTYYQLPAAAGVNSSIRDVAIWMRAQLGEFPEVLPESVLTMVHTPRIDTPGELAGPRWRRERVSAASYALGWRVFEYAGHPLVFHAGAVQGYRAMVGLLPDQGFGVAILWNSNSGVPGGLFPRVLDRQLELGGPDWLDLRQLQLASQRKAPGRANARPVARLIKAG